MIHVGRLAPVNQWDQTIVEDLLTGKLYPHAVETEWHSGYPKADGCALLIPGRYWAGHEAEIGTALSRYQWVLLFVTSDEESLFDARKVVHPNVKVWQQAPRHGRDYGDARFFGFGYTPHTRMLPTQPPERTLNVFLSAQRTHQRRVECFNVLEGLRGSRVHPTMGFTQGLDPAEYVGCMSIAKVAPAPSGAVSPDSFRLWEALEAHTVPLTDLVSPVDGVTDYWWRILPDAPFPVVEDWSDVNWSELLTDWLEDANTITAWWMRQKRLYAQWLVEDLGKLGAL